MNDWRNDPHIHGVLAVVLGAGLRRLARADRTWRETLVCLALGIGGVVFGLPAAIAYWSLPVEVLGLGGFLLGALGVPVYRMINDRLDLMRRDPQATFFDLWGRRK